MTTTTDSTVEARVVLGTAFTGAGVAHVVKHEWFERLVLEQFSRWRKPISAVTAVIQIVGGISMFVPRLRLIARWANVGLLLPTLPGGRRPVQPPGSSARSWDSARPCASARSRTGTGGCAHVVGDSAAGGRPANRDIV